MNRTEYQKVSELSAWDLDAGCRNIIDQTTPANRRLKKRIRRADRKRYRNFIIKREEISNDEL